MTLGIILGVIVGIGCGLTLAYTLLKNQLTKAGREALKKAEEDGELSFTMPRFRIPEVRVNPQYAEMLSSGKNSTSRAEKEAAIFEEKRRKSIESIRRYHEQEANGTLPFEPSEDDD